MRLLRFFAMLSAFAFAVPAFAQSTVLQGGPWAPGHAPQYVGSGSQPVVLDGGGAGGGVLGATLGEIGITSRSATNSYPSANSGKGPNGEHACLYDAPITNVSGYHYLCFDPNALGGGLISYGASGGASYLPLTILVNGVAQSTGSGATSAVRTIASGAADALSLGDSVVIWNSSTASAKTETIPACSSAIIGHAFTIADKAKTAGSYNITLLPVSGTIGGVASRPIQISGGAQTILCDGVSDWVLE